MTTELRTQLQAAIHSAIPLEDIVALLRRHRQRGATRDDVYAFLTSLRNSAQDEATQDRILEIADFVAGFCAPHMKIWDN